VACVCLGGKHDCVCMCVRVNVLVYMRMFAFRSPLRIIAAYCTVFSKCGALWGHLANVATMDLGGNITEEKDTQTYISMRVMCNVLS